MCGRFVLAGPGQALSRLFGLAPLPGLGARYNIAPSQPIVAVKRDPSGLVGWTPRWGLVPSWAGDTAGAAASINARAESAATKPTFRDAFRARRCLVPADAYYEWSRRPRQPWLFRRKDGAPFAFAGLWETWGEGEQALETATILTTEANPVVAEVHPRMPLVLPATAFERWLDPALDDPREIAALLAPEPAEAFVRQAVSPWVNDVAHDDPRCIEPVRPAVQGTLPFS